MSWGGGEELLFDVWKEVRHLIPEDARAIKLRNIIEHFCSLDMDAGYLYQQADKYPELQLWLRGHCPEAFGEDGAFLGTDIDNWRDAK